MRFKLDENLPVETAVLFKDAGHEATTVAEQNLAGATDERIYAICKEEQIILLTLDSGFADIRLYPPDEHSGIIVFRTRRQDRQRILHAVKRVIQTLASERVGERLWIVDETRIRVR